MKKLLACILLFLFFPQPVLAKDNSDTLSLSDIVYADLATRHYLDNVSIYYTDGKPVDDIKLSEGRHWLPASTVKTFAAMYAYKLISEGKLNPQDTFTIESKNSVPTELVTDELPTLWEGNSYTVNRLIEQMITQSDNTAFNVLMDVLGRDNITNYIQSLGLTHSRIGSKLNLDTSQEQYEFDAPGYGINTTTAKDYARAFLLIKQNKIPGSKELFAVLKGQKINSMIPLYLPKNVICAHKTGDLDPLYHDGGICQDQKQSYVLTLFTNAGDTSLLAHLSNLIYTKDLNLVGKSLEKKSLGYESQTTQPIDQLALIPPSAYVLGASTTADSLTQPITAADLGITAQDLSLVIKDQDLPTVIIPADSRFHILSDTWQIFKKGFVLFPKPRLDVDLETLRLRIAEVKDLEKRGKAKEARVILQSLQQGLTAVAKEQAIIHDSSAQNTLQAVSETRFAILASELEKAKGDEKITLIKNIASQAKATLRDVQPKIPDAANATNPSQKPLIGEVVKSTSNEITVKTAGGQEVTVSTQNNNVVIKERGTAAPSISPTPSASSSLRSLTVGTTVALFGSTTNNTFSPTLILTKIPKEMAAPQPVTVVKVDIKNNTMVVVENGIYTQVNINKNTVIKGADTNIPLKEIKAGDVVVVHGQPLTQTQSSQSVKPTTSPSPTRNVIPTLSISPSGNPNQKAPKVEERQSKSSPNKSNPSAVSAPVLPSTTPSLPKSSQPRVIQSTSIRVLEKKQDAQAPALSKPAQPPAKTTVPSEHKDQQSSQKPPEQKTKSPEEKKK